MAKILSVDDKDFVRIMLRKLLEKHGHEVVEAENGKVALEVFAAEKPDLTLCDVIMPVMDGITTLSRILETTPDAKVIMVTSLGAQAIIMEAMERGAKDVVVKPFDEDKIIQTINKYL